MRPFFLPQRPRTGSLIGLGAAAALTGVAASQAPWSWVAVVLTGLAAMFAALTALLTLRATSSRAVHLERGMARGETPLWHDAESALKALYAAPDRLKREAEALADVARKAVEQGRAGRTNGRLIRKILGACLVVMRRLPDNLDDAQAERVKASLERSKDALNGLLDRKSGDQADRALISALNLLDAVLDHDGKDMR